MYDGVNLSSFKLGQFKFEVSDKFLSVIIKTDNGVNKRPLHWPVLSPINLILAKKYIVYGVNNLENC